MRRTASQVTTTLVLILVGITTVACQAATASPLATRPLQEAQPIWDVAIPVDLQGQLYEAAIRPGSSEVVLTSPAAIWKTDEKGELSALFRLRTGEEEGESAALALEGGHVGILTHRLHEVAAFELVDLTRATLAKVDTPLHFHYRLAPKGDSFVGIDAAGAHTPAEAQSFIYRFFDRSGQMRGEVKSPNPQPNDSAYTPDGSAFLVNNRDGVFSFSAPNAEPRWEVRKLVKSFAPANGSTEAVVVTDAAHGNIVEFYQAGQLQWSYALERNVRNLGISPNGEFIAVSDQKSVYFFQPGSKEPLWSFSVPDAELSINSAVINDRGTVALGAQHSDLRGGVVFFLDAAGQPIFQHDVRYELSNAWIPTVQFDATGTRCLIRTLESLTLVSVE